MALIQYCCCVGRNDAAASPPVSPRSACSTPGRITDAVGSSFKRCLPSRQHSSINKQRFSQDSKRLAPFCGNPWAPMASQGTSGSVLSSSSSCSIVRAIASLGLEGSRSPNGSTGGAAAAAAAGTRGSISKAKKILAEAISSVPGAHGLASCASAAADTGVLSPLLTIIRNNGVVKSAGDSAVSRSSSSRGIPPRRSSFSEAMLSGASSSSSLDGSFPEHRGVRRRSSFSEAAGGLNSEDFTDTETDTERPSSSCSNSTLGSRSSSLSSLNELPTSPVSLAASRAAVSPTQSPVQQQQKVVDCLDTVRYLAMDDSNRMALIDLGAVELLITKLQPTPSSMLGSGKWASSSRSVCSAPAVVEATLSALSVLAKHDATKARVWENPGSPALLQLLSQRHTSPVVKAAHLCVANLAWSVDLDRSFPGSSGSSSVFDSVSSHPGRDDAMSTASSCCGSTVLLTTALVPALAAGLHAAADAPVLLSLLKLLSKAAISSFLAPGVASSPCSSSSEGGSNEQLCAVSLSHAHSAPLKVGWQQAIFALPPLLMRTLPSQAGPPGRPQPQPVLGAALELMMTLTEQHPEFHTVMCAAGCVPPLLALLVTGGSSTGCSEHSLQAACVLNALLDCPDAVHVLGQDCSLSLLLQVLADGRNSADVRMAMLYMLRRLAAATHSCVEVLKMQGAVATIVAFLQQVRSHEAKRTAMGLLQLLGKQVVVRPRGGSSTSSGDDSNSNRSSFESDCSAVGQHHVQPGSMEAVMHSLDKLALQEQERAWQQGQHRLAQQQPQAHTTAPYYLHAH